MATSRVCSVKNCGKPMHARGLCGAHYWRQRKHGDPLGGGAVYGAAFEFFSNVVLTCTDSACLTWPFGRLGNGYASMHRSGRSVLVSRVACQAVHGDPPTPRHEAAHSCGRGHLGCVNPYHLRWATNAENQADRNIHGTHNRGERHGRAKLTAGDVNRIRSLRARLPRGEIALLFDIDRSTVCRIQNGQRRNVGL